MLKYIKYKSLSFPRESLSGFLTSFGMTVLFILLFSFLSHAQIYTATSSIDTSKIKIGEPVKLKIDVRYPAELNKNRTHQITWPGYTDTITKSVEIIEQGKIDTSLSSDKNTVLLSRIYTITSFDTGFIVVPPLRFFPADNPDRFFETQAMLLEVLSVPVDTTLPIRDIKEPLHAPFTFREAIPYIIGALALVAIILGIWYYIRRRRPKPQPVVEVKEEIPLHIRTLTRLEELNARKLWQEGKIKEYHSELSEIIRHYIEERFYINALEQTTDEILLSLRSIDISNEARAALKQLLVLSDLVKFAKEKPLPNENELSMDNAVMFVNSTVQAQEEEKEVVT